MLDPALLRPGRFDRVIAIAAPTDEERLAILRVHARGRPFAPDIVLADIARRTDGLSGAELEQLLRDAGLQAVREAVARGGTATRPLTIDSTHLSTALQARQ
jgi:SpoVK/Ycf46/Vps4 family AAA+-type ATPase